MIKVRVSKDWMPEERLQLIAAIMDDLYIDDRSLTQLETAMIKVLAISPAPMLEGNRHHFAVYLEAEK